MPRRLLFPGCRTRERKTGIPLPTALSSHRYHSRGTRHVYRRSLNVCADIASSDLHFRKADTRRGRRRRYCRGRKNCLVPTNVRVQSASVTFRRRAQVQRLFRRERICSESGQTSVRVIVRDKSTGRYGSLDVPLAKVGEAERKNGGKKNENPNSRGASGCGALFVFPSSFFLFAQSLPVFRAKTDVVVVPVTVTDRSGRFVPV